MEGLRSCEDGLEAQCRESLHNRRLLHDLGFDAIARRGLRDLARPVLKDLVGEVNEAASLGVLDGADIVYVEQVQAGLVRMGVDIQVGSRIPAVASAIGQALLACPPEPSLGAVLRASRFGRIWPDVAG